MTSFRPFVWIGLAGVLLSASCSDQESSLAQTQIRELLAAIMSYHDEFGEYPTGSDLEISLALTGSNPSKKMFVILGKSYLSDEGGLIDPWGEAYRFAVLPEKEILYVYSVGPNGLSDWVDDIGEVVSMNNR